MSDWKSARDAAADAYSEGQLAYCRCAGFTCSGCEAKTEKHSFHDFQEGWDACRKHMLTEDPAMRALVEALYDIKDALCDRLLAKGPLSKKYAHSVVNACDNALAEFKRSVEEVK